MSVTANIEVQSRENVLVIPLNAVKQDEKSEYVEVVENGAISRRPVT